MKNTKFGLTGLAVLIGAGLLVLFDLIDVIAGYEDVRIFYVGPLGRLIILILWTLGSVYFLFKGKPLLAALLIGLKYLIDNGLDFVTDLLSNNLDFESAAGFGSLLLFGALVFFVVALILERKKLEKPQFACPLKTPHLILILTFVIFVLVFYGVVEAVFAVVLLILIVSYGEERYLPLVIAILTMSNFFNLIDSFIAVSNDFRVGSIWWFNFILGTLVFIFAILSYFIPDLFTKGAKKIKEKVSHKEESVVDVEVVEEQE